MKSFCLLLTTVFAVFIIPARAQTNQNIVFRSQLSYGTNVDLSNIWGYVDSLGNEYALVGTQTGLSIVDVTNPANPIQKFTVAGTNSFWREVQVWGKYAYVTTEGCCNGLQIINLSNLPASVTSKYWTGSGAVAGQVTRIHTVHIRDGYAYLNGSQIFGGAALIVSLADPWNPVYVGNTQMALTGTNRYVHDCYVKNDTLYGAHIYGGFFSMINIANKANPVLITTQTTPSSFTHNLWMADNGSRILYTTDEVSNSYLASYNVSNPSNIVALDRLQGTPGSGSIIHNTYIRNSYAINSYYKDGITIVDVSRPENMITVGRYDTYTQGSGNGFNGAWGVYPYLPSGNIIVSDIDNGLFVLTPTYIRACYLEGNVTDACTHLPLNNVNVVITGGTHHAELSKLDGSYKTGTSAAGSFTVSFSKTGYTTKVIQNVMLQNGVLTPLNVELSPVNAVSISNAIVTNVLCNGQATGAIDLSVTSGTAPVTYSWTGGAATQDISGKVAGNYQVLVTDGAGCTAQASFIITQPSAVQINGGYVTPNCMGAADGLVYGLISGGVAPYSHSWSSFLTPAYRSIISNSWRGALPQINFSSVDSAGLHPLPAGVYTLNVTDGNGCPASLSITLPDPPNPCAVALHLKLFIEGFYTGGNEMTPVIDQTNLPGLTDTVIIGLADTAAPYAVQHLASGIVTIDGDLNVQFPSSVWNHAWYIVIRHRNSIETWSKQPVFFNAASAFSDFTIVNSVLQQKNVAGHVEKEAINSFSQMRKRTTIGTPSF
ncbi:MAG: choice-of-anchor B family protein [Bacteroidia bacterium]